MEYHQAPGGRSEKVSKDVQLYALYILYSQWRRQAEQKGSRFVHQFAKEVFHQLGMRVWVLSGHIDSEGNVCLAEYANRLLY